MSSALAQLLPDFSQAQPIAVPEAKPKVTTFDPDLTLRRVTPQGRPVPASPAALQAAVAAALTAPAPAKRSPLLVESVADVSEAHEPNFADTWFQAPRKAAQPGHAAPDTPYLRPENRAELIGEAEARGREQGRSEARAEAEATLVHERADFERRFTEARKLWTETEAEALASGFAAALRAFDAELTGRIARLLMPVLTDSLRRQALTELSAALARLLDDPHHAAIRVSGPDDLLTALAERLGPLAGGIEFAPGDATEVHVSADETVIETQIAAWTRLLASAAGES